MKSELESVRICSTKEERRRRDRLRHKLRHNVLLCYFIIWMGSCMKLSVAQFVGEAAEPESSHRISKRVVSTFSPLPFPHNDDNKIDDFLSSSSSPFLDSSSSTARGKISFPSPPNEYFNFRQSNFRFPSEPELEIIRAGRNLVDLRNGTRAQEKIPPAVIAHVVVPPSEAESSRKASPDVQDIIDGIVKLLGGRVHNTNNSPQQATQQSQITTQQTQPPPLHPLSQRPYNLFNPTKPIYYNPPPTVKPTRINNRGPPLPTQLTIAGIPNNSNTKPAAAASAFEAIPLEALNSGFNLTQSKFGPPFPLTHVGPGGVEAPYKQGIPLPQQLVPLPNFSTRTPELGSQTPNRNPFYNPSSSGENPSHSRPTPGSGEKIPLLWPTTGSSPSQSQPEYNAPHKIPGTIVDFEINDNNKNQGGNVPVPSQKPQTPTATTLLVPVTPPLFSDNSNPSSIQTDHHHQQQQSLEDDELDAAEEDSKILQNIQSNENNATIAIAMAEPVIEPTITEQIQFPTFQLGSSVSTSSATSDNSDEFSISPSSTLTETQTQTQTFEIFTTKSESETQFSTRIQPTSVLTSSSSSTTIGNYGFNIPSTTSPAPQIFYETIPSRAPSEIQPNGMTRPTPALRPGMVIHDGVPKPTMTRPGPGPGHQGFGSVEVVSAETGALVPSGGKAGETFDITVTANQNYAGQATGQPFVIPVDLKDEIITAPNGNQQFVSIDGKRTYFNLHPSTPTGIGSGGQTKTIAASLPSTAIPSHPGIVGAPSHPFAKPALAKNTNGPSRAVSTSLSISSGTSKQNGTTISKTPPNLIRRPITRRPIVQSVRIDTCIVGDDSTCNSEQFEICRTESGVSSCLCRAGYARKRHREPCKAINSLVLSIRLDKLGDKKLSYNADYFNPNSEIYQSLEWETIHGLDTIMSETNLHQGYLGAKLDAVGFDGRHAVVNSTILIQENPKVSVIQLTRDLQRQIVQVLTNHRNNFGKSQLWVEAPVSAISSVTDVNECDSPDLQDCDPKANCVNTFGSFECKCEFGYGDPYENIPRRSGRKCETCNGKNYCNSRGECQIEDGQKVCKCAGNFYGSQCEIDGEVLAVAIGASVSALVIIGLTLACLCMWSRRWKREEQKAALMSRTLFGGMASQALSYLSKNSMNSSNPYQQHITLDERLRWAQVADPNMNGNIYVSEPLSMHANPGLLGPGSMMETPPMMSARRSADTCDTTVDDLFEERHQTKRPKSRSSQLQSGIYYDLEAEPQSEIYGTRAPTILSYPAQFCVPMNPYPHARGFYN